MKMFSALVGIGLGATATLTAGAWSAPNVVHAAERLYFNIVGYSVSSCKADAIGCLRSRETALEQSREQIATRLATLRTEVTKVAAIIEDRTTALAKTTAYLDQGKAVLKAGQVTGATQFIFANRNYDGPTLRAQLETLFAERSMLEGEVRDAQSLQVKLAARLQDLRVDELKVASAIAILPSQLSLLEANASLAAVEDNSKLVDTALQSTEASLGNQEDIVASAEQLEKRSQDASGLTPRQQQLSAAFDRYMSQ